MAKKSKAEQFYYKDNLVHCPICGHDHFWKRKTLMNTKRMVFWKIGWLNRPADNYIGDECGYVLCFSSLTAKRR